MALTCSAPVTLLKYRQTLIHLAHADLPFAASPSARLSICLTGQPKP